ncbi:MAG: DUF2855 family protein [Actinomycetota bacterium]
MATSFQIQRTSIRDSRFVDHGHRDLESGEVRFGVDFVALTSNNVTYAVAGDMLDYWGFFPADLPWGHVPAMGYGTVIESANPDVEEGSRHFGFFPMADQHIVLAKGTDAGLFDVGEHRANHAPAYRQFANTAADPTYDPEREAHVALLRGLFLTGWLAEDLLFDNDNFDAEATIITSASSKTSIAMGWTVQQRGGVSVGLTSERNRAFVEGLGCYTEVVTYDEIGEIDADRRSVVVDMAGNGKLLADVHNHFGGTLAHSMAIGGSHWESFGEQHEMAGPAPQFFFAPAQIEKRNGDWGNGEPMRRVGEAFAEYVKFTDSWLEVQHASGQDAFAQAWDDLTAGEVPATVGLTRTLND